MHILTKSMKFLDTISAQASWKELFIVTMHFLVGFIEYARENFNIFFALLFTLHFSKTICLQSNG